MKKVTLVLNVLILLTLCICLYVFCPEGNLFGFQMGEQTIRWATFALGIVWLFLQPYLLSKLRSNILQNVVLILTFGATVLGMLALFNFRTCIGIVFIAVILSLIALVVSYRISWILSDPVTA